MLFRYVACLPLHKLSIMMLGVSLKKKTTTTTDRLMCHYLHIIFKFDARKYHFWRLIQHLNFYCTAKTSSNLFELNILCMTEIFSLHNFQNNNNKHRIWINNCYWLVWVDGKNLRNIIELKWNRIELKDSRIYSDVQFIQQYCFTRILNITTCLNYWRHIYANGIGSLQAYVY